jgi:tetrahydromethanopterin S-methyltransferase subunit G
MFPSSNGQSERVSRDIVDTHHRIDEVINEIYRRVDELQNNVFSQLDSRLDKLEQKLTIKK